MARGLLGSLGLDSTRLFLSSLLVTAAGKPLDVLYSRLGGLNGAFFANGWGNLGLVDFQEDLQYISRWPPNEMNLDLRLLEEGKWEGVGYKRYEASFSTPCMQRIWDALPPESRTARVQLLLPAAPPSGATPTGSAGAPGSPRLSEQWREQRAHGGAPAAALHLAATGDQDFERRMRLGGPLLREGVATMALESPFYGARRPADQRGAKLRFVSDLLLLGWATICESLHLLHWLELQGYGPKGICGLSMGGVHACMTAGLYPGDLAVTPLLAPRSAAVAYCDGAMQPVTAWQPLVADTDAANNRVAAVVAQAAVAVSLLGEASRALEALQLQQQRQQLWQQVQLEQQAQGLPAQQQQQQRQAPPAALSGSETSAALSTAAALASSAADAASEAVAQARPAPDAQRSAADDVAAAAAAAAHATAAAASGGSGDGGTLSGVATAASSTAVAYKAAREALLALLLVLPAGSGAEQLLGLGSGAAGGSGGSGRLAEQEQCYLQLKQVLETYTDVTRYPRPRRPDAAVLVAATSDAYVSLDSVMELHRYWPGSELRTVSGGHVSAFLMHQATFRGALLDSLARLEAGSGGCAGPAGAGSNGAGAGTGGAGGAAAPSGA